eukprot:1145333-Pelagomonas_calceolata.AAC.4
MLQQAALLQGSGLSCQANMEGMVALPFKVQVVKQERQQLPLQELAHLEGGVVNDAPWHTWYVELANA